LYLILEKAKVKIPGFGAVNKPVLISIALPMFVFSISKGIGLLRI